jgi:pimeloyl-ACP methyl ester carboxylesterase
MPFADTNDVETFYQVAGEGQPVVFVHTATGDHQLWTRQVRALEGEFCVLAYDLRDHGRTDASPAEYGIETLAADLDELLATLNLHNPVICGVSLGGMVAQCHAVSSDTAAGYVFASTYTPEIYSLREHLLIRCVSWLFLTAVDLFGYDQIEDFLSLLAAVLSEGDRSPRDVAIDRLRNEPVKFSDAEILRIYRAVRGWFGTLIDYSTIDVPAMVLYGEEEPAFLRTHAGTMSGAIPNCRAHAVAGAGHKAHLDAPETFTSHIREFLERVANHEGRSNG